MSDPYRSLPDERFWSRAMLRPAPGQIDLVGSGRAIQPHEKVATMGSCFAQHLTRHLPALGLRHYAPEGPPPGMSVEESSRRQYGVFSARYGNVYTARQAIQLFDRAFGGFRPVEDVWETEGGWVDAFRPRVDPIPHPSPDAARSAAAEHLSFVRDVFTHCDWLILTLGLTEAWRSRQDGAVYPLAPGVAGGRLDPSRHEFVNFTPAEVESDLVFLMEKLLHVNPRARILLTVSPVPLAATYESRHVWVSTTYSKAALRVAADAVERRYEQVVYFPAFEVITSPAAGGRYYADDLRQVTEMGVRHVVRLFAKHFTANDALPGAPAGTIALDGDVSCDEEEIERALRRTGFR